MSYEGLDVTCTLYNFSKSIVIRDGRIFRHFQHASWFSDLKWHFKSSQFKISIGFSYKVLKVVLCASPD